MSAFKNRLRLSLTVLVAVLGFFSAASAAPANPIRIGATVSLTGRYKGPSAMMQNAYRLWARQTNRNGGLLGRPIKLIFYDDHSRKQDCRQLYEKLIETDKVDLVLAPYGTPLTYVASAVTERNGYVLTASAASGPQIWERGFKRVFGIYATADRYFIGYLDLLARSGATTLGMVYEKSIFNIAAAQGARHWAKRFGLQVVFDKGFDPGSGRLAELSDQALAARPDGMLFSLYPPDTYAVLAHLGKTDDHFINLAFTIAPVFADFYRKAGPPAENVFAPSHWEPDLHLPFPGSRKFIREFEAFAHVPPTYHAASAYAAGQILSRAITETGSLDQARIADFIRNRDTISILGRFKVDERGRQVGHNPLLIQWQNGRKQIVWPTRLQTARALLGQTAGGKTP